MQVKDIMTKKVITVKPDTPIYEVARLLFEQNLTGMPVIDESKKVVGIITEYDLMSRERHIHIPTFLDLMKEFKVRDTHQIKKRIKAITQLQVKELMTQEVVRVSPDTEISQAAKIFADQHINPLPVVNETGQLVGIVSRADIVKLFETRE